MTGVDVTSTSGQTDKRNTQGKEGSQMSSQSFQLQQEPASLVGYHRRQSKTPGGPHVAYHCTQLEAEEPTTVLQGIIQWVYLQGRKKPGNEQKVALGSRRSQCLAIKKFFISAPISPS